MNNITPLRIIFAGTPDFAAIALEAILQSEHQVVAIYAQPDKPAGRGLKTKFGPVKELALLYNIPLNQPITLKDDHEIEVLEHYKADVMVVAAYGLLLPAKVLHLFKYGCINIHPSLLPRWRGAAPIQRTIHAGDKVTGVTIMQMETGLDTGPILLQKQYVLDADETTASLHDKLAQMGATTLLETLDRLQHNDVRPIPQDNSLATYAHKISKEEALIDWQRPALELEQEIRAFNPWPIAYTTWQGKNLRIWSAKAISPTHPAAPRTIIRASNEGVDISTGQGVLRLLSVQLPGGKILSINDFYNAKHNELIVGQHFI